MLSSLIKQEIARDMSSIKEGFNEGRAFIAKTPELLREAYMYLHSQGIVFYTGTPITTLVDEYLGKGDNGFRLVRYTGSEIRVLRVSRGLSWGEKFVEIGTKEIKVKRGEKI